MKLTKSFILTIGVGIFSNVALAATDLRQATVKETVNDVQIIPAGASSGKAAKISDVLRTPDVMRTGSNSRAELLASDQTVARVGANTVFSFDQVGRKINLQQGTILFHAPTGRGGGVIQTAAATAAVTGTTIMVVSTRNGGFKVLVLEGKARVQLPNGKRLDLVAGQLSFILPGNQTFTSPITFRLGTLVNGSRMVNGFNQTLASKGKIQTEINRQEKLLIEDTGIEIGDFADENGIAIIDNSTRQINFENAGKTLAELLATDYTLDSPTFDLDRVVTETELIGTGYQEVYESNFGNSSSSSITYNAESKVLVARDLTITATQVPTLFTHNNSSSGHAFLYADRDMFVTANNIAFPTSTRLLANRIFRAQVGQINVGGGSGFINIGARDQLDVWGTVGMPNTIAASFSALSARTVILTNFHFMDGSTYVLYSQTGLWNGTSTGSPIIPGQTNLRMVKDSAGNFVVGSGGPGIIPVTLPATETVISAQQ
jgi:hypothetical protein